MSDQNTPLGRPAEPTPFDPFDSADEPFTASAEQDAADVAPVAAEEHAPPLYGIGPFSIREVCLLGVWFLAFVVSFFPLYGDRDLSSFLGVGGNVWTAGIDWILTIGVPTAAVFLIVLRRFSPGGIRRVGSLGVDQFASVAFSVAAVVWGTSLWTNIARAIDTGFWLSSWVVWAEVILMLAGVALTVFAPLIAPFHEDFLHRPDQSAHRVARATRPVVARPLSDARYTMAAPSVDPEPHPVTDLVEEEEAAYGVEPAQASDSEPASAPASDPEFTAAAEPVPSEAAAEPTAETTAFAPEEATARRETREDGRPATAPQPASQPFWALVPADRQVVDESGAAIFTVGPTAWALVIEDRGEVFVIRAEDGRVGYLHDTSGVTRG